jgi:cell division protein FtsI/penicillin-binding protein 2
LKKSSNIGTAKIALMMGEDRVARMMRTFKFGVRTNLPFAQETRGVVPKLPFPDKLTITRAPIGYSVQTSILQLTRAYCALANGGFMPELRIIDRRWDPVNNRMLKEPYFSPVQTFENPRMVKELVEMLISVTGREGTARQAAIPGFQVAGKTGTSRKNIPAVRDPATGKIIRKSHYAANQYYASFAGFVPAHEPRLVMVVTLDNPKGASYGGTVAVPAFRNTMERTLRYLNIQPSEPETGFAVSPGSR